MFYLTKEQKETELKKRLLRKGEISCFFGACCRNADILRNPEVELTPDDFISDEYKIIYFAMRNLALSNMELTEITEVDIDVYLSKYPAQYQLWNMNDGITFINHSRNLDITDTYKTYYTIIKKFSLLYQFEMRDIDTTDLFNPNLTDLRKRREMEEKLESMSIDDIIQHYTMKISLLKEKFSDGKDVVRFRAGDDIHNVFERLLTEQDYGYPYKNGFYNDLFRGMRKKKYMLRSAGTGTGKTRQALADILNVAVPFMYNVDLNIWEDNNGSYPALFISTELEKEELQITMLAIISGVPENVIRDGIFTPSIEKRIKYAMDLLDEAPVYCEYVNDFNIRDIEMIVEKNIIQYGVEYVAFDYIQVTPKLSRTMSEQYKMPLREDQMLVYFSEALKQIANKYEIYLTSSTQVNRQVKEYEFRDASGLRGGQATADKVDTGILTFFVSAKDKKQIKHILNAGYEAPNFSHWCFKNRGGKRMMCIIWSQMDLGNMREKPLFVTDYDFNLLDDIEMKEIKFGDDTIQVKQMENDNMYEFKSTLGNVPDFETRSMDNQSAAPFQPSFDISF